MDQKWILPSLNQPSTLLVSNPDRIGSRFQGMWARMVGLPGPINIILIQFSDRFWALLLDCGKLTSSSGKFSIFFKTPISIQPVSFWVLSFQKSDLSRLDFLTTLASFSFPTMLLNVSISHNFSEECSCRDIVYAKTVARSNQKKSYHFKCKSKK